MQSTLSAEEVQAEIIRLSALKETKSAELGELKSGQVKVDKNEWAAVEKRLGVVSKQLKVKKSKCNHILAELLDNIPKKKTELLEEIGIELPE